MCDWRIIFNVICGILLILTLVLSGFIIHDPHSVPKWLIISTIFLMNIGPPVYQFIEMYASKMQKSKNLNNPSKVDDFQRAQDMGFKVYAAVLTVFLYVCAITNQFNSTISENNELNCNSTNQTSEN